MLRKRSGDPQSQWDRFRWPGIFMATQWDTLKVKISCVSWGYSLGGWMVLLKIVDRNLICFYFLLYYTFILFLFVKSSRLNPSTIKKNGCSVWHSMFHARLGEGKHEKGMLTRPKGSKKKKKRIHNDIHIAEEGCWCNSKPNNIKHYNTEETDKLQPLADCIKCQIFLQRDKIRQN